MSCLLECESVWELGPPPDLAPPPPIPSFLRPPETTNGSCDLCHWAHSGGADGEGAPVTRTYSAVDDVWYLVIVSVLVGVLLVSILLLLLTLRCKQSKLKSSQQATHKLGKGESSAPSLNPPPNPLLHHPHHNHHHEEGGAQHHYEEKAVWSSLHKRDFAGSYVLQHHIINPDFLFDPHYEKTDYGSVERPIPPLPPPPHHHDQVRFTPTGHAYYAHPAAEGAFDNNAFDDSEAHALLQRKPSAGSRFRAGSRRLPRVQTTHSGPMDHLVIKDGAHSALPPRLPMVTQLHCDRIRSTALV